MATTSIRVDPRTHSALRDLSEQEHKSIGQVVSDAVEQYQKEKFWREYHEDYAKLRADPKAWLEYQNEVSLWDTLSGDGLENEEPYYADDHDDA